jgi:hypothetical protein
MPVPLTGSPHRFKYRLYFGKDGTCLVRIDNEQGKGDHKHIKGVEYPYIFKDIRGEENNTDYTGITQATKKGLRHRP